MRPLNQNSRTEVYFPVSSFVFLLKWHLTIFRANLEPQSCYSASLHPASRIFLYIYISKFTLVFCIILDLVKWKTHFLGFVLLSKIGDSITQHESLEMYLLL